MLEQKLKETKDFLKTKFNFTAETAVVLGSGLGKITDSIHNSIKVPYKDIPHFFNTSVMGHTGELIFGELEGKDVLFMSGRIHAYEGHSEDEVAYPVRLLSRLGIKNLLLTNASGGINESFSPGDLCVITDQINLTGRNPLIGKNDDSLGPRFPDMSCIYDKEFVSSLKKISSKNELTVHQGIYTGVLGPSYETPAEVRMLRAMGGDLVGMSTVLEAIAAHHCGLRVAGVACVTNMASGILDEKLSHSDIKEIADKAFLNFSKLVREFIKGI